MDGRNKKWCVCRLTIQKETGKVRWCFGSESSWTTKVKILMFLPVVLLTFVALYIVITHFNEQAHMNKTTNVNKTNEINQSDANFVGDKRMFNNFFDDSDFDAGPKIFEYDPFKLWNDALTSEEVRKYQGENMLRYMDMSTSPCDDFYQYACGNWSLYHPIPPDKIGYDTFELVRENLDVYLKELLENIDNNESLLTQEIIKKQSFSYSTGNVPYFEKLLENLNETILFDPILKCKYIYKSCMNEELISAKGSQPLFDLLKHLRYWPVIQSEWSPSKFDLVWLLGQLRLYNNDIFIEEWVGIDIKNSSEHIIQIDQSSLGLPNRIYYLDPEMKKYLEAYRQFLLDTTLILGADYEKAKEDVDDIIRFETDLAEISLDPESRRNLSNLYHKLSLGELQNEVPEIYWMKYFKVVTDRNLPLETKIVCYCIDYLKNLVILLKKYNPRTITNYILWRFVRNRINNLDERFNLVKQRFYHILFGREKAPPRWQFCVAQVNSYLGMALGHLFVKRHFDENDKNDTLHMTRELQEAFLDILEDSDWLGDYTKSVAISKIKAMRLKIGYPDLILDTSALIDRYLDIKVHPNYYFENCLVVLQHVAKSEHLKIGKTVNKNIWNTPPTIVNAYYSRNKNQIMFPAGILQPPFYHQHYPQALNYGGIGVVIGHEISHGFDDKGKLFDEDGNLNSWWTREATEKFQEKSKCLIDQYNSFVVPEINTKLDGASTQGENIADNGGIKQAYKAYKKWLMLNEDSKLPGFNATDEQLFFINFAQVWCGTSRPDATRNRIKSAVHSPGRFRVLGTLRNSEEFSKAFSCKAGSLMNPKKKCTIW
ncbi:neprilysin-4-like [Onthophagus taurus]|uniref:neprilysin-4-like n=1 Tax=Onthophagus taurus TaxID=166361 RepID=UPI0039BDCEAE